MMRSETKPPKRIFCGVPLPPNIYFEGREVFLEELHRSFSTDHTIAITQAITGLGGIGKTETALRYIYEYEASYTAIFWTNAEDGAALSNGYRTFAQVLQLSEWDDAKADVVREAMRTWLNTNAGWLLVLDNVEEPSQVEPFLPTMPQGHILLTSRGANLTRLGVRQAHKLEVFTPTEAFKFLMERTERLQSASPTERQAAEKLVKELGYLPLALEQAGAYLKEQPHVTFDAYLTEFRKHPIALLEKHPPELGPSGRTVAVTWNFSIQKMDPATQELLRVCAFLAPDPIPTEIFTQGWIHYNSPLAQKLEDALATPLLYGELLSAAKRYALIDYDDTTETFLVHRLVQAAIRFHLKADEQRAYMEQVTNAVEAAMPSPDVSEWPQYRKLLPHLMVCANHIKAAGFQTPSAARLLQQTASYLKTQASYSDALSLYQQAQGIFLSLFGPRHVETAQCSRHLGVLYTELDDYRRAEQSLQEALQGLEQDLEPRYPAIAECLNSLGELYQKQGRKALALEYYQRTLDIQVQVLMPHAPDLAMTRIHLGIQEPSQPIPLQEYLTRLHQIPAGAKDASKYHDFILEALEVIFHPNLTAPRKEQEIHEGRKRIDILFRNLAQQGFFYDVSTQHKVKCPYLFFECKNYSSDPKNPEFDQLAGRFSEHRGKLGILVCRRIKDRKAVIKRCQDAYTDERGLILAFEDADIVTLLTYRAHNQHKELNDYLHTKLEEVVLG